MRWVLAGLALVVWQTAAPAAAAADRSLSDASCVDISGEYAATGRSDSGKQPDILQVAFRYSLSKNPGDPRDYEALLHLKFNRFSMSSKDGALRIALFNDVEQVKEFGFPVTCARGAWRSEHRSTRYLDGYNSSLHSESLFALDDRRDLTVITHTTSRAQADTVTVRFVRLLDAPAGTR